MGFIINHEIVIVTVITEGGKYGEKPPELMMEGSILLSMKHWCLPYYTAAPKLFGLKQKNLVRVLWKMHF